MKRILFMDDDPYRFNAFLARGHEGNEVLWVMTAADCIAKLRDDGPWDEVHLDHDLTETYEPMCSELCGMEVVRYVATAKPDVRVFIVHTWNELAAPHMMRVLQDAGYYTVRAAFTFGSWTKINEPPPSD